MSKRILVVEDSPFQAEVLSNALSELDCEVFIAPEGKTALEEVVKDIHIVILDTRLPDMDGFELCEKIKEVRPEGLIVVMTTGKIDAVDAVRAKQSGADDYAVKTEDFQHLIDVVKRYM